MNPRELLLLALLAAAIAAAVFFFLSPKSNVHDINGLKVITEPPASNAFDPLSRVLLPEKIKIEERLFTGNRSENTAIIIASSEMIAGLSACRATPFYVTVDDGQQLNCEAAGGCSNPIVIVRLGDCDCIKVNNTNIVLEGSASWLKTKAPEFRKLFSFAVKDTCVRQQSPSGSPLATIPTIFPATVTVTPSASATATPTGNPSLNATPSVALNASNGTNSS